MKPTPFLAAALAIYRKDLRAETRGFELSSLMLLFTLLGVLVFSFALELDRLALESVVSGVLWVIVAFGAILGLNRSLAAEREGGNLDAMLMAPVERVAIYAGKMLANFTFSLGVGLLLLPLMSLLYNLPLLQLPMLGVLVLGTFGFAAIGTLLAAMAVQTRAREALLPIIMLPAALPLLLAVVRATNGLLDDSPAEFWAGWLALVFVIDAMYLLLSAALFPFVLED